MSGLSHKKVIDEFSVKFIIDNSNNCDAELTIDSGNTVFDEGVTVEWYYDSIDNIINFDDSIVTFSESHFDATYCGGI